MSKIEIRKRRKNIQELKRRKNMSHRITINPVRKFLINFAQNEYFLE